MYIINFVEKYWSCKKWSKIGGQKSYIRREPIIYMSQKISWYSENIWTYFLLFIFLFYQDCQMSVCVKHFSETMRLLIFIFWQRLPTHDSHKCRMLFPNRMGQVSKITSRLAFLTSEGFVGKIGLWEPIGRTNSL